MDIISVEDAYDQLVASNSDVDMDLLIERGPGYINYNMRINMTVDCWACGNCDSNDDEFEIYASSPEELIQKLNEWLGVED